MLAFHDWLPYVEALEHSKAQQAICLLNLIDCKLDLANSADFKTAVNAISHVLSDDDSDNGNYSNKLDDRAMEDQDYDADRSAEERKVWLEGKHSRSFILMSIRRAFCMRQFRADAVGNNLEDSIDVLLAMRRDTGYPEQLGRALATQITSDQAEMIH